MVLPIKCIIWIRGIFSCLFICLFTDVSLLKQSYECNNTDVSSANND